MFLKWCPQCGVSVRAGGFCFDCRSHLTPNKHSSEVHLPALYRYQGILRSVILRSKVNNENTSYQALCDLFAGHPVAIAAGIEADIIIPAPSSLWGRLRGRFDLAQGMALALGSALERPVELFPPAYYFNYRKRAGKNQDRGPTSASSLDPGLMRWQSKSILLIDDIITSGFTLKTLSSALVTAGANVRFLALASSPKS